jgi:hypothetical protein
MSLQKSGNPWNNKGLGTEQIKQHLVDSSRHLADLTASMVYDNPSLLKALIDVSWLDRDPLSQRAARVVSICCCNFPELFKPFERVVIRKLKELSSEGTLRNYLKILSEVPLELTAKDRTRLMNICFDYLTGRYPVAIQVYSMEILYNLSRKNPEIGIVLSNIVLENLPGSSAGYRSRGNRILKKLQRVNFQ